ASVAALLVLVGVVIAVSVHKAGQASEDIDQAKAQGARLADTLKQAEVNKKKEEERERQRVQDREEQLGYLTDMQEVQDSLQKEDTERAKLLLDRHRPGAGKKDNRCWEWYFLKNRLPQTAVAVQAHARPVTQLAWRPDGRALASVANDGA